MSSTLRMQILTNQEQLFNAIGILGATCEWDAVRLVTTRHPTSPASCT